MNLEIITGPMFSGKTEELIRRLRRFQIAGKSVDVFSPDIDTRYGKGRLYSHSGQEFGCIVLPVNGKAAETNADVVAFDEAQFFDRTWLIGSVKDLIAEGKYVIVAGLDKDFRGEPFGAMPEILAMADRVNKLTAICNVCGEDATMTQRLVGGEPAPNGRTIVVGGLDTYEARCRKCHSFIQG